MVGQNAAALQLERNISVIKYVIFSLNVIVLLFGVSVFGLSVYMRAEEGFQEWVDYLEMQEYYIGLYILIIMSIFVMAVSFVSCVVTRNEFTLGLYASAGMHLFCFVLGVAGTCVLLDYSTYQSKIQPIIRQSMRTLIVNSHNERALTTLKLIQESIGCCGADGANDYLNLLKPLPNECRDTVTGLAFFYGCVEEISWYMESRSGWLAGLVLSLCLIHVMLASLSMVLAAAFRKEERSVSYKR